MSNVVVISGVEHVWSVFDNAYVTVEYQKWMDEQTRKNTLRGRSRRRMSEMHRRRYQAR